MANNDMDLTKQFLIYSPLMPKTTKSGSIKKTSTDQEKLTPKTLNENLGAMKTFYQEKEFSDVSGEKSSKKSGETLAGGMSSSINEEKKTGRKEPAKTLNPSKETQEDSPQTEGERDKTELKDEYSREELAELRNKTKEDYGSSLVEVNHKNATNLEEHEEAQLKAYEGLTEKIESGAVRPDAIQSDMLDTLELRGKPEVKVDRTDQIPGHIASELQELTGKGFIKKDEAALIQSEAERFTGLYTEAYPDASPQEVFELVRDNARKLAYQTERDKNVFSGSDHGTRHVLEGNMRMADRMLESLGDRATAKDKVLVHQIITDHDIGYTTGVAQAKGSFSASKDHPIFSTKYIEENKDYYTEKFGSDGYEMIKNGILMHSYPKSEYNTPTDQEKGFNPDTIRSITSTVDALGVTAETKCPAFFREPDVVKVLQKVQLYADTHDGKVPPEAMSEYKAQLRKLAEKEPDADRKSGYLNAIENQFDPKTVEFTLGQYTGVLKDIKLTEKDGKILPEINMDISRSQALLGDIFGDKLSTRAFVKEMEDFGVPKEKVAHMGKLIRQIRDAKTDEEKQDLMKNLRYESDKAVFQFGAKFDEVSPEIQKTFEDLEKISIRHDIRDLSSQLKSPQARTPENITTLMAEFRTSIGERASKEDLLKFMGIQRELEGNMDNPTKFEETLKKLNSFTTEREREFMGAS